MELKEMLISGAANVRQALLQPLKSKLVLPKMKRNRTYARIVKALALYGPGNLHDIARWSKLRPDQVHKRCPDLLWNPDKNPAGVLWRPGDWSYGLRSRRCLKWHLITEDDHPPGWGP